MPPGQRPRKKGPGDGSVYRRRSDGRWTAAITLDGHKIVSYGTDAVDARAKLRALLQARDERRLVSDERLTVERYLARWLETVRPALRPRVWERYEQYVRVHALPAIGTRRLGQLRPAHLQDLYAARLAAGVSPSTVHHLHAVLHRALGQAKRLELIAANPADAAQPPRMAASQVQALGAAETRRLLDAAAGDRLQPLYLLAVTTGMRQGELLALRWADVDLDRGVLAVRASLSRPLRQGLQFLPPKTASSQRVIRLSRNAALALRAQRERLDAERLLASDWEEQGLVFPNRSGRPLTNQILLRQEFYPLLARAGLPRVRFHALRHTAASLLLAAGTHPKIVQELLGHSAITITLQTYSHVLPELQSAAADAMDRLIDGF